MPRSETIARSGFTLVELLVVLAIIGILAVALLATINPIEQINRARDTATKADAAQLLDAMDRFYASHQCYPWDWTVSTSSCASSPTQFNSAGGGAPVIVSSTNGDMGTSLTNLVSANEIKPEFQAKLQSTYTSSTYGMWMSSTAPSAATGYLVHLSFVPVSQTYKQRANYAPTDKACAGGTVALGGAGNVYCVPGSN